MDLVVGLLLGMSLAACAGLRAFLPLFVMGVAFRLGWTGHLGLAHSFSWIASDVGLACLGSASVLELLADKIPVVDHALNAVATVVRPAAGGVSVLAVLGQQNPAVAYAAATILAGSVTLPVHLLKSGLRLGTDASTAGAAAPFASAAEDATSAFGTLLAMAAPAIAAVVVLLGLFGAYRAFRGVGSRLRPRGRPAPDACA